LWSCAVGHLAIFGLGALNRIAISIIALALLTLLGTGMGDIKLLALVLVTHSFSVVDFLSVVFLLAIVHIVVLAGIHRSFPPKIPLAPSIFIGLFTYLATS
jgi:hypothetical protein